MEPKDVTHEVVRSYIQDLEGVDVSLRNFVAGKLRNRDVEALSSCTLQYDWLVHSVEDWRFLRQIEAFYKKNKSFADSQKCFEAALESFTMNEEICSQTNIKLKKFVEGDSGEIPLTTLQQIHAMQRWISTVLGPFDPFLDRLYKLIRVTPGATAQSSRRNSLPQQKLKMRPYCTSRAKKYVYAIYRMFGFDSVRLKTTTSNRIELVPKNWKTDRTIACEPEGNLPLQLAFDRYAKRRLKRFRIDLSDQSANQRKAKHASIYNDYATVDFRNASDTISYNTVKWLLPNDWFSFLCAVRSPAFRGKFGSGTYSKFSSMGNGATFCLETLIFAAACFAVGSRNFLVYGDDVIIEKKYYDDFVALAGFLGFTVNGSKSFHDGPFRESCGKDYFNGVDVTPVYIRDIDDRKVTFCHLVNTLKSVAVPFGTLWNFLDQLIVEKKLPLVPFQESTLSGVWIDPETARQRGILFHEFYVDKFYAFIPKTKRIKFVDSRGYYLWFLYKNSQVLFGGPWELSREKQNQSLWTQTSSAPLFMHYYVRKKVVWRKPDMAMPDFLYLKKS